MSLVLSKTTKLRRARNKKLCFFLTKINVKFHKFIILNKFEKNNNNNNNNNFNYSHKYYIHIFIKTSN